MAAISWAIPTAVQTLLTTGLDSLANAAEAESAAIANQTNLDMVADFVLAVDYAVAPAAGVKTAELYIEPAPDGTNYPSVTSGGLPQKALLVGTFESVLPSTTVLEYLVLTGIPTPPVTTKYRLSNTSGQAYRSSASAKFLKSQPYQIKSV